jgi:FMN-dependent NADH-azoreductase
MENFRIPSLQKVKIDPLDRPGKTSQHAGTAVDGLARGKMAILVISSSEFSRMDLGKAGITSNHIYDKPSDFPASKTSRPPQ